MTKLKRVTLTFLLVFTSVGISPCDEFDDLLQDISKLGPNYSAYSRLKNETFRRDALIQKNDHNPVDVILRRTQALLTHLESSPNSPDLSDEQKQLNLLAVIRKTATDEKSQRAQFTTISQLRRRIAFKNPLLDFNQILFLKHHKQGRGQKHMVDQYLGFNQQKGGGVFVLENAFGDKPSVRNLLENSTVNKGRLKGLKLDSGSFISLDLNYDAQSIAFAFTQADATHLGEDADWSKQRWSYQETRRTSKKCWQYHFRPESTFHLFTADIDGTNLKQLTDGMYNEYDPCFMPNGRLAYVSEFLGGNQRCGTRALPTATLHSIEPSGSDPITLSWHDTNEWHPSIDHHGMIIYTRWDYIDRDSDIAHHLWTCYPDGRDPRSSHGNYPNSRESRPWMEMSIRAIPDSDKFIAVAAPHHGQAYGSLVLLDLKIPDDRAMSQIKRITPEVHFPESESAPAVPHQKGRHSPTAEVYGTPWPLSEDFYLCVYDRGEKNYGLYLVDSFGNRELLYQDDQIPCLDPIPIKARKRPPIIPAQTTQAKLDKTPNSQAPVATVAIMNVYNAQLPLPKGTQIKELRVVAVFPKGNSFMDEPRIGFADQSLARGVLGTVPVEEDGSVYFECPTDVEIYFQLIDNRGEAVQSMRSGTYLHAGERLSCIGCHENKHNAIPNQGQAPLAMLRPPSKLKPEASGSYPLTFPRLVQPVLNIHCVECHASEKNTFALNKKTTKLTREKGKTTTQKLPHGWSNGFYNLRKYAWGKHGGNGVLTEKNQTSYSIPGKVGAKASRLLPLLKKGHYNVKLTKAEWRRITLWLDCNSNFYGAYKETEKQARGEVVMPQINTIKPSHAAN